MATYKLIYGKEIQADIQVGPGNITSIGYDPVNPRTFIPLEEYLDNIAVSGLTESEYEAQRGLTHHSTNNNGVNGNGNGNGNGGG